MENEQYFFNFTFDLIEKLISRFKACADYKKGVDVINDEIEQMNIAMSEVKLPRGIRARASR
jgi:hypothetical protein